MTAYRRLHSRRRAALACRLHPRQGAALEHGIWHMAAHEGVPLAVPAGTLWYNFRQYWFTKLRKREDLSAYGDSEESHRIFKFYGTKEGWRSMLEHFQEQGAAVFNEDETAVLLRSSMSANAWARRLKSSAAGSLSRLPALEGL